MSLGNIWGDYGSLVCDWEAPKPPSKLTSKDILENIPLFLSGFDTTRTELLNAALKLQIIFNKIFRGEAQKLYVFNHLKRVYFTTDTDPNITNDLKIGLQVPKDAFPNEIKGRMEEALAALNCDFQMKKERLPVTLGKDKPPSMYNVTTYTLTFKSF